MKPKALLTLAALVAAAIGFALPGPRSDNHAEARSMIPLLEIGG